MYRTDEYNWYVALNFEPIKNCLSALLISHLSPSLFIFSAMSMSVCLSLIINRYVAEDIYKASLFSAIEYFDFECGHPCNIPISGRVFVWGYMKATYSDAVDWNILKDLCFGNTDGDTSENRDLMLAVCGKNAFRYSEVTTETSPLFNYSL